MNHKFLLLCSSYTRTEHDHYSSILFM